MYIYQWCLCCSFWSTCVYPFILNVHLSVVLVLFILEHLCLPSDLNVHVLLVLVLFILENLCLPCYFKCKCISGVSVVHSGTPVFTLLF